MAHDVLLPAERLVALLQGESSAGQHEAEGVEVRRCRGLRGRYLLRYTCAPWNWLIRVQKEAWLRAERER